MVGRKVFIFVFYFEAEVLMPKYNKTYPYLLWFLHPSVQAYHININIVMERRKCKFSDGQFSRRPSFGLRKIALKQFERKTMKIKNN